MKGTDEWVDLQICGNIFYLVKDSEQLKVRSGGE